MSSGQLVYLAAGGGLNEPIKSMRDIWNTKGPLLSDIFIGAASLTQVNSKDCVGRPVHCSTLTISVGEARRIHCN